METVSYITYYIVQTSGDSELHYIVQTSGDSELHYILHSTDLWRQ